jgi:GNAT superfamily N-acetyltransferase
MAAIQILMSNLKITVEDHPTAEERRQIFDGLHRYNASQTNDADCPSLAVFLRNEEDNILGGLLGETYWGWLHVEFMWIEDAFRGQGYGEKLLASAEQEAIKRGCGAAYLDTFSFQAFKFYERCGYEVFGTLEEFPSGHQRFFMRKSLNGERPNNSLNPSPR